MLRPAAIGRPVSSVRADARYPLLSGARSVASRGGRGTRRGQAGARRSRCADRGRRAARDGGRRRPQLPRQSEIREAPRRHARRGLPLPAALRRPRAGARRGAGDGRAVPRLRRSISRTPIRQRMRPSGFFGAAAAAAGTVHPDARLGGRRARRARRRGRRARRDRPRHRRCGGRGHRRGGRHRARLLRRRERAHPARADRQPRHHPSGRRASARTDSASPWARAATSRCRRSAASSSRTTSRSAPTRRSTAAPTATR